jgi:hypothetical protein
VAEFLVSYDSGPVIAGTAQEAAKQVFEEMREPGSYPPLLEVINLETGEVTLVDMQKEDP